MLSTHRFTFVRAVLAGAVLMCGLGGAGTAGAAPGDSPSCWSLRDPVFASSRGDLGPSERADGVVEIVNGCARPVTVRLSAGRTVTGPDGAIAWSDQGSAGGALTFERPEVVIAGGASEWVAVTVTAAADATPGDHPLAVGAVDAAMARVSGGVDRWRPVPLRIAGALRPAVDITPVDGVYRPVPNPFAPGAAEIAYTVTNTGTVTVSGQVVAGLTGLYSRRVFPEPTDLPEVVLVPGASYHGSVRLDRVWPGVRFDAQVGFRPTDIGGIAVSYTEPGVVRGETMWALPFPQILVIALCGGVLFAGALARRRRHVRRAGATTAAAV
ncbi:hypothetical protein [Nocardia flavorosea]|uniref:DUF4232 domain-containing protein n=1 Tax=Nocardia flavorosea TaxID=53429 RepID=A0A846YH09_9NOCA|nr:hypothetical protein [Nocardia flavorosea]NKY57010.1 hypothetical protein [Nocardia flavorosea]